MCMCLNRRKESTGCRGCWTCQRSGRSRLYAITRVFRLLQKQSNQGESADALTQAGVCYVPELSHEHLELHDVFPKRSGRGPWITCQSAATSSIYEAGEGEYEPTV
jgi:hypothetical protein